MAAPMEVSLPQTMLQKLLDLLKLESLKFCLKIHFHVIHQIRCQVNIDYHNQHESFDWSLSRDLPGAAICGELPELSETDAERSTGVPLLSAAESNSRQTVEFPRPIVDLWIGFHFRFSICKNLNKRTVPKGVMQGIRFTSNAWLVRSKKDLSID